MLKWKVRRVRGAAGVEDPLPPGVDGGAQVTMAVTVRESDGELDEIRDQTDYWIRWDGEWFWVWAVGQMIESDSEKPNNCLKLTDAPCHGAGSQRPARQATGIGWPAPRPATPQLMRHR